MGSARASGKSEIINERAVTLDDFVAAGEPPPELVEIDVEGGEYEILCGGNKLFAKQRPLVIAEVHHQQVAEQITSWLSEYQYWPSGTYQKKNFPGICLLGPQKQMERPGCGTVPRDKSPHIGMPGLKSKKRRFGLSSLLDGRVLRLPIATFTNKWRPSSRSWRGIPGCW